MPDVSALREGFCVNVDSTTWFRHPSKSDMPTARPIWKKIHTAPHSWLFHRQRSGITKVISSPFGSISHPATNQQAGGLWTRKSGVYELQGEMLQEVVAALYKMLACFWLVALWQWKSTTEKKRKYYWNKSGSRDKHQELPFCLESWLGVLCACNEPLAPGKEGRLEGY